MSEIWNKFYNMSPMKYYQPTDYSSPKAQDMITNKNGKYVAEQKWDGEFCRCIKWDNKIVLQSRNISKVTGEYGDKTALVPHIVDELMQLPNGTVVLGELCWADITKTSKDVGTILRCKPDKAIARQAQDKLVFRTFDCLAYSGVDISDSTYDFRLKALFNIFDNEKWKPQYCFEPIWTDDNFEDFLQEILAKGGEGIVIHSLDYVYQPGGRPAWCTLKVKKITTELELPVVDFIEPKKYYEGTEIDSWKYYCEGIAVTKPYYFGWKNGIVVNNNGTMVKVASGLTDEDREWLATKDAAAKLASGDLVAVVSAMETTEDGSLRHPRLIRLRTDL